MNNHIFIPQKIKVGFQNRSDTYTQKLAYVIYYDEKGKLRKEPSWESWRDKKIDPEEYDNVPTEGFVLNKKVGGYCSYWSNFRQAYVRVYDPRGFEFEISVPNLLYILENTSSIKGKGLEGEFVYGWDGTDLILIPTSAPDYIQLSEYNDKRFARKKIVSKDLKIGATYLTKDNQQVVYLGKFDAYEHGYLFDGKWFKTHHRMAKYAKENNLEVRRTKQSSRAYYGYYYENMYDYGVGNAGKHYFFVKINEPKEEIERYGHRSYIVKDSISGLLIDVISENPASNYAELFEELEHQPIYSPEDDSKEQLVPYDRDEFYEKLNTIRLWGEGFKVIDDGMAVGVEIKRSDDGLFVLRETDKNIDLAEFFELQHTKYDRLTVPMTPDKIFNTLRFVHVDHYLANGKLYRRVY